MQFALVGLSHHKTPIEVLERFSSSERTIPSVLEVISRCAGVREAVLLSTCNRMELYLGTDSDDSSIFDHISSTLARVHSIQVHEFAPYVYHKCDEDVVSHLMRVAGGLDSLVLGEPQILGQVKTALRLAVNARTAEGKLGKLFEQALSAGKRVQAETGLGRGAFSIGHIAVDLAGRIFDDFARAKVLILGAGKMSEQAAQQLVRKGVRFVVVQIEPTIERYRWRRGLGGRAVHFDEALRSELAAADIVISATGAPHPILRREMLAPVMRQRRGRPLFLIDIAMPRDIDTDVLELSDVILYNILDLQNSVQEYAEERASERVTAEKVVAEEVTRFMAWSRGREAAPSIAALKAHLARIQKDKVEIFSRRLSSPEDRRHMQDMAQAMMDQVALTPILRLKLAANEAAGDPESRRVADLVSALLELFDLQLDEAAPQLVSGSAVRSETTTEPPLSLSLPRLTGSSSTYERR